VHRGRKLDALGGARGCSEHREQRGKQELHGRLLPDSLCRCSLQLTELSPGGQMNLPPRARHLVQTVAADQVHQ
jgi:hypothetical protein